MGICSVWFMTIDTYQDVVKKMYFLLVMVIPIATIPYLDFVMIHFAEFSVKFFRKNYSIFNHIQKSHPNFDGPSKL